MTTPKSRYAPRILGNHNETLVIDTDSGMDAIEELESREAPGIATHFLDSRVVFNHNETLVIDMDFGIDSI